MNNSSQAENQAEEAPNLNDQNALKTSCEINSQLTSLSIQNFFPFQNYSQVFPVWNSLYLPNNVWFFPNIGNQTI